MMNFSDGDVCMLSYCHNVSLGHYSQYPKLKRAFNQAVAAKKPKLSGSQRQKVMATIRKLYGTS